VVKFRRLIVVTGTPGVGKTTFSRLLAKKLNAVHIDLGELALREKLVTAFDKKRRTYVADLKRISSKLRKLIKSIQHDIIIDGHYAANVVSPNDVNLVFVLRCHPQELERKLKRKGFTSRKIAENVAAEILDSCLLDAVNSCGVQKICEIDVTNRKRTEILEEALNVLEGRTGLSVGKIDWLKKLEEEGKLNRFISLPAYRKTK
jgi:adenylate kinase